MPLPLVGHASYTDYEGLLPLSHSMTCTDDTANRTNSADCTAISRPPVPQPGRRTSRRPSLATAGTGPALVSDHEHPGAVKSDIPPSRYRRGDRAPVQLSRRWVAVRRPSLLSHAVFNYCAGFGRLAMRSGLGSSASPSQSVPPSLVHNLKEDLILRRLLHYRAPVRSLSAASASSFSACRARSTEVTSRTATTASPRV